MTDTGAHVLVIEEERDVSALLAQHLRLLGCQVTATSTVGSGLALADVDPPDLVMISLALPGTDKLDMVRKLRVDNRTRQCRIASFSALDEQHLIELTTEFLFTGATRKSTMAWLLYSLPHSLTTGGQP